MTLEEQDHRCGNKLSFLRGFFNSLDTVINIFVICVFESTCLQLEFIAPLSDCKFEFLLIRFNHEEGEVQIKESHRNYICREGSKEYTSCKTAVFDNHCQEC